MEYLIFIFGSAVVTFIGGVLVHIVAYDLHAQIPSHATRLINLAARRLPLPDQSRYEEEWLAHLEEAKGALPKFRHAIECCLAAQLMRRLCEARSGSEPAGVLFKFGNGRSQIVGLETAQTVIRLFKEVKLLPTPTAKEIEEGRSKLASQIIEKVMADRPITSFIELREVLHELDQLENPIPHEVAVEVTIAFVDRFGRQI